MKTLLIINRGRREKDPADALVQQIREALAQSGADVEICLSASVDETDKAIAAGLANGMEALWLGGGDGTLYHALNQTFGQDIAYGIVPMGTINALARALGLPLDPLEAVKYLLRARPVKTDVGRISTEGREVYFFTYATVGIHAAVFHNINTQMKKRWGSLAFWESGVRTAWNKSRLPRLALEINPADGPEKGDRVRDFGYSFTLSNVANYSGFGAFTNERPASPGYFEMHNFRRTRLLPMFAWYTVLRLFGRDVSKTHKDMELQKVRQVAAKSHHRMSVQADGEPLPKCRDLEFCCLKDAVKILLQSTDARELKVEEPQADAPVSAKAD